MTVIDVHAHFLPRGLSDRAAQHSDQRWPTLVVDGEGSRIVQHGDVYRVVDDSYYSLERRLEQMDELGIDRQVLSPLPVSLASWADPALAGDYCAEFNELLAEAVRAHPGRFSGLGMVPLQDPQRAADQLSSIRDLGLSGVEIGTWLGDHRRIDDAEVAVFLDAAAHQDLSVLLHPNHPDTFTAGGPKGLELGIGVGSDTARALASLFLADAFTGRDGLRLCTVHGGGSFFWFWPRFRRLLVRAGVRTDLPDGLFADTAGLDARNLAYLRELLGDARIVFGSDLPATGAGWTAETLEAVRSMPWDAEDVLGQNSRAFLGLDPRT